MNINKLRSETKGCATTIHFNNAGASLMPDVVLETIKSYFDLEAAIGGYEAAIYKAKEIEKCYESVGRLLNCEAKNIAFTGSATDSYNRALSSIPFQNGDMILTTESDYVSNHLAFMALQKRFGVFVHSVANDASGELNIAEFEMAIKKTNPKLIAVTHVPTNSGLIQPVEEIGKLCKKYDILYLVDVCQSVGQLPVDVMKIQCDFASSNTRKFLRGPRGCGFLYVSDKILAMGFEPLFIDISGATWTSEKSYKSVPTAKRFEDFEFAFALVLAAGVAADYFCEIGAENVQKRNAELCKYAISKLQKIKGVRVLDFAPNLSSIITIAIENYSTLEMRNHLNSLKINTSYSAKSSALLDYTKKNVTEALRISPHYYNTEAEIDVLIEAISAKLLNC